ncbi:hypothetical protein PC41400_26605 [Paenibacillus chitinolyticus]|uniref:Uncharacterized protein n=1 Tax=Paenibacillus chitinolyticus TaxID=79263 RepID=A0A410X357_9BACL|nr:hypothetical protein [Paenibacillus chitinolyticus]MCY9588887.1 hypothetical protein [Paenibacillus chitinolyticus]MCY9597740.1 hypothetical protein [Paenibacillus chitinolyticus]QAV21050.1 hypothetical protein PC41400_26605 [Paenibacillus chitinolyticus]
MKWFTDYKEELELVFEEAVRRVAAFPAPLHTAGMDYLDRFHPLKKDSTKNYICYLLPFWLKEQTRLPADTYRTLSVANVFVMLHFFVQDDFMDTDTGADERRLMLPLSNLFQAEYSRLYREYFPADSPFWAYADTYLRQWAECVAKENEADYFRQDPVRIAYKAAPVKLASTGALLLSGQEELIEAFSRETDHTLLALQMADDWADWREDLDTGSYNCLLSLIRSRRGLKPEEPLSEDNVKQAVFIHGCLRDYAEAAAACSTDARTGLFHAPHMDAFHQSLLNDLLAEASHIDKERGLLGLGGFTHLLSKRNKS